MRIVCISDTHKLHRQILLPPGDILVIAGDITYRGEFSAIEDFNGWLSGLSYKAKFFVAGNHDLTFQHRPQEAQARITNAIYLQDKMVTYGGINFYGSPWTPWFHGENWVFNAHRGEEIRKKWAKIPLATDVLITHGPPKGILDRVPSVGLMGCEDLLKRLEDVKPKLHIFGHLHAQGGQMIEKDGTIYVNASVCGEQRGHINEIVSVEI